jgi:hypothetical protein
VVPGKKQCPRDDIFFGLWRNLAVFRLLRNLGGGGGDDWDEERDWARDVERDLDGCFVCGGFFGGAGLGAG